MAQVRWTPQALDDPEAICLFIVTPPNPARKWDNTKGILGVENMAHKIPNPPPGFDELTVEEKLDYVQSL